MKNKKNKIKVSIDRNKFFSSSNSVDYKDITPKNGVGISWEDFENYINKHSKEPQRKS